MNTTKLKLTNPTDEELSAAAECRALIERKLRYIAEAEARMCEVTSRSRNARHYLRRLDHKSAIDELAHVVNETGKLRLHLAAWDEYMKSARAPRPTHSRNS